MRRGFTLIEILVAVLIIGILAAIALPQYQAAVLKSRYMQAVTLASALRKAQDVYYMTHGVYATKMTALDINPTGCKIQTGGGSCAADTYVCFVSDGSTDSNGKLKGGAYCQLRGTAYLAYSADPKYKWPVCMAEADDEAANQVCKSMGGEYFQSGNGHNDYYLK